MPQNERTRETGEVSPQKGDPMQAIRLAMVLTAIEPRLREENRRTLEWLRDETEDL